MNYRADKRFRSEANGESHSKFSPMAPSIKTRGNCKNARVAQSLRNTGDTVIGEANGMNIMYAVLVTMDLNSAELSWPTRPVGVDVDLPFNVKQTYTDWLIP